MKKDMGVSENEGPYFCSMVSYYIASLRFPTPTYYTSTSKNVNKLANPCLHKPRSIRQSHKSCIELFFLWNNFEPRSQLSNWNQWSQARWEHLKKL